MDVQPNVNGMNRGSFMNGLGWIMTITISLLALLMTYGCRQGSTIHGERATTPRLGIQLGHIDSVVSAAFSGDGRTILTASKDGTARLWEVATGKELRRFTGYQSRVTAAAFDPAGRTILTANLTENGNRTVQLWDAVTGRELRQFTLGGGNSIKSAVFAPHGRILLTTENTFTSVYLWELATGRERWELKGHEGWVTSAVFAPDGHTILTASEDGTARLWAVDTGQELRRFIGHGGWVTSAVFAPDGRTIFTANGNLTAQLWDVDTGKELRQFTGHEEIVTFAVFAPDGRTILTASRDGTARLWDVATGQELRQFTGHQRRVTSAVFAPDGRTILTASWDQTARLWDVATGRELRQFTGHGYGVISAVFAPDGRTILTASEDGRARLWDVATGQEPRPQFIEYQSRVTSAVFAPDGRTILTASWDQTARLWDTGTGTELRRFLGHGEGVISAVFAPNGRTILTRSEDRTARLWDVATGKELRRLSFHRYDDQATSAVFAPDGQTILTVTFFGTVSLWDVATGQELRQFTGHSKEAISAIFAPDGRTILTASWDGTVRLWDLATGKERRRFTGPQSRVTSAVFASDGRTVLIASEDGTVGLWDVDTGQERRRFTGHQGRVTSVAFAPNGRTVLTASSDQTTRLWDVATGRELAHLISFGDGTWVVVDPKGRFDTNNLEEIKGLHWIMPDDPMHALPLEIFMRDYYEPRLLPRVLAGEHFSTLPTLGELNHARPKIEMKGIQVEDVQVGLVAVTVEVASDTVAILHEGKLVSMESGAYDLRLFRDGQLVGQFPDPQEEPISGEQTRDQALAQWRQQHAITLDQTGKQIVTFRGIMLPRTLGLTEVKFSAYAFNVDRVKSATARGTLSVPKGLIPRQGRAYVVTVGVNATKGNVLPSLKFAANDAKVLSTELTNRLKTVKDPITGQLSFGETNVVPITLITDFGRGEEVQQLTVNHATKARIRAVIDKLAGKPTNPRLLEGVLNVEQLQLAQPEDLVVIAFSTHGDTDRRGQFYLMPYDLGNSSDTTAIRQHAISSEELSEWLRPLDAGELVMIVDACHSAGAVENQEFKPGPMGSRGLGQLAFDKGMRILAASQRDQYALETDKTQQGLLSYALVREGLTKQAADFQPKDGKIQLAEWLTYGVHRVPGLYEDYRTGRLKARAATPLDHHEGKQFISIQQPALFDFARGRDFPLVSETGR